MAPERKVTGSPPGGSCRPAAVVMREPSQEDVRRSVRDVQVRHRGQLIRIQQVVTDLLSRKLVPLVKQGHVKVSALNVTALCDYVRRVLKEDKGAGRQAQLAGTGKDGRLPSHTVRSVEQAAIVSEVPVMTSDVLSRSENDVRDAVQNVYDRDGHSGDLAAEDVVAEMMATWLSCQSGKVEIAINSADLIDYTTRIEKILPAVRPENPWRSVIGPVYRTGHVLELLSVMTATELDIARKDRAILGLRTSDGHVVYPAFQFENGKLIDGLAQVLRTFPDEEALAWDIACWMNSPMIMLNNRSIMDTLRAGHLQAAEQAAQVAAERWGA